MKLMRYKRGGDIFYGVLKDDQVWRLAGCPFGEYTISEEGYPLSDVSLLPPVEPKHLIAVGKSYRKHIDEMARRQGAEPDYPVKPIFFFEAPGSIIAADEPIVLPADGTCKQVDLEGELAIVIGKQAKNVSREDALSYVLGYTIANDVSARGIPDIGGLWGIGLSKSLDTFTPLGPWIETEISNPNNLHIMTRVNGEIAQDSNTGDMIFTVEEYVSYCSSRLTLYPGDVIITGTPDGVRPIHRGERVEITIDGIGTLSNPVV
jgi:2-keto-4-pentenoate hydratase/2-oxohepta-3-ene-1,7-dioic acid hydratase in catechol pathway